MSDLAATNCGCSDERCGCNNNCGCGCDNNCSNNCCDNNGCGNNGYGNNGCGC